MRGWSRGMVWLAASAWGCLVHGAEPGRTLTVEEAVRIGLERSVRIANLRRSVAAAEETIGEVRARVLPDLSAHGGYTRYGELEEFDMPEGRIQLGREDSYTLRGEASQLLYDGGSVQAALRAARAYRTRASMDEESAARDLACEIRVTFHALLLSHKAVEVQEAAQAQIEALRAQAEDRLARGVASEFEALSARVRAETGRAEVLQARLDCQRAESRLGRLIGFDADERVIPAGDFDAAGAPVDLASAQALALRRRAETRRAAAVVTLAEADLRVEQGGLAPELRATASYTGQNPPTLFSSDDAWEWRWQTGVTAEWSLFDGGRRRHVIRRKRIELDQARAEAADLARTIRREVEQAWLDLEHALEAMRATAGTAALAERNLAMAGERYRQGLSTYLEFTDVNQSLRQTRLNHARAQMEVASARARLACACGLGPEERLDEEMRR